MPRKRYLSTEISVDARVRKLAERSEFAALLYTWMIPHALDDGSLPADPEELLMTVVPGFRWRTADDIAEAIGHMLDLSLMLREGDRLHFPEAFYHYQTYITGARRHQPDPEPEPASDNGRAHPRNSAQNHAEPRNTPDQAQNRASLKSSSSFKSSSSLRDSASAPSSARARARETEFDIATGFSEFRPRKATNARPGGEACLACSAVLPVRTRGGPQLCSPCWQAAQVLALHEQIDLATRTDSDFVDLALRAHAVLEPTPIARAG